MDHLPALGLAGALGRLGAMGPNDRPYPQQASSALDCNMGKEWMSNCHFAISWSSHSIFYLQYSVNSLVKARVNEEVALRWQNPSLVWQMVVDHE